MRFFWLCFLALILMPARSEALLASPARHALSMVIHRQLMNTMCTNPQVFLLPEDLLRRNLHEKIVRVLAEEQVPSLSILAERSDLQYESIVQLNLLMEIAALLQLPSETALLAKIRLSVCMNEQGIEPSRPAATAMGSVCQLQSLFERHPDLAIEMAERSRRHLQLLARRYPSVQPPDLRSETVIILNQAFDFNELKTVPRFAKVPFDWAVFDLANQMTGQDNGVYFIPDRSIRYNQQWMEQCSLAVPSSR